MTTEEKVSDVQTMVKILNETTKMLEGEGCKIEYTVSEPFNKIDFVQVTKLIKY